MPYVETVDDLAESIANLFGAYSTECGSACDDARSACRSCFVIGMKTRIRAAVKNDRLLREETPDAEG